MKKLSIYIYKIVYTSPVDSNVLVYSTFESCTTNREKVIFQIKKRFLKEFNGVKMNVDLFMPWEKFEDIQKKYDKALV